MTPGSSYASDKVKEGGIEAMICGNMELSALDRKLSGVYAAASRNTINEHPPLLKAEQRGWVKSRNECWKSDATCGCVRDEYQLRIAELMARYRLVPDIGTVRFICEDDLANDIVVTFFKTDPPTMICQTRRQCVPDVFAAER